MNLRQSNLAVVFPEIPTLLPQHMFLWKRTNGSWESKAVVSFCHQFITLNVCKRILDPRSQAFWVGVFCSVGMPSGSLPKTPLGPYESISVNPNCTRPCVTWSQPNVLKVARRSWTFTTTVKLKQHSRRFFCICRWHRFGSIAAYWHCQILNILNESVSESESVRVNEPLLSVYCYNVV